MFIIKEGVLKVEKNIIMKQSNLWPTAAHEWSVLTTKQKVLKKLKPLLAKSSFGLYEMLTGHKFHCRITVESDQALVISINANELLKVVYDEEKLFKMLD